MAEGMSFSFPSLLFHEGRTYGQPEVVPISLPQVQPVCAHACRARSVGGAFSQTCSCRRRHSSPERRIPCRLLCAGHSYAEGVPAMLLFLKLKAMLPEIYTGYVRKEESRYGDFSLHNQNSRTK